MEIWHWNAEAKVDPAVVAYWYAKPGGTDCFPAINTSDLRVERIPAYVAPRVAGAIEGEEMEILEKTGGKTQPQAIGNLSGEQHLWWIEARPGDRLVLGFDVPEVGKYHVFAQFLKAGDYGIVKVSINDQPAGEPIDFYNEGIVPTGEIDLGEFTLAAGQNHFVIEIVGANEAAVKGYMCGLDYVRLSRAE